MNLLTPKAVTKCRETVDEFNNIRDGHVKVIEQSKEKLKEIKAFNKAKAKAAPTNKKGKKVKTTLDANQQKSMTKLEDKIIEEQNKAADAKQFTYNYYVYIHIHT